MQRRREVGFIVRYHFRTQRLKHKHQKIGGPPGERCQGACVRMTLVAYQAELWMVEAAAAGVSGAKCRFKSLRSFFECNYHNHSRLFHCYLSCSFTYIIICATANISNISTTTTIIIIMIMIIIIPNTTYAATATTTHRYYHYHRHQGSPRTPSLLRLQQDLGDDRDIRAGRN